MCPGSCAPAFCGDGFKLDGVEECDDGNNVDDDGCTNSCISNGATCLDIQTNMDMWSAAASGVDLRSYTNSTLHWIGCPGDGCAPNSFYCMYDGNAGTLQFGTTSGSALRAVVDPNDQSGEAMPNINAGCCSNGVQNGKCNAPDSDNNGVNINMVEALCAALGYDNGMIVRQLNNNACPEPHVTVADGSNWTSDWVGSQGFGAEYLCSN